MRKEWYENDAGKKRGNKYRLLKKGLSFRRKIYKG